MASSTSSLAARRAGRTAATTPAMAAMATTTASWVTGMVKVLRPWSSRALHHHPAERRPDGQTEGRAQQGDDHRLPAHGRPHLGPGHADGPQEAELPGPLEDREGQGVGDAQQGDDHGQGEQGVDEVEQHVDLRSHRRLEGVPVLHLGQRVLRRRLGHRRGGGLRVDAVGEADEHHAVELVGDVGLEEGVADHVGAGEVAVVVEGGDGELLHAGLREPHGDRVAHRPAVAGRLVGLDGDLAVAEVGQGAVGDAQVEDLLDGRRVDPDDHRAGAVDLGRHVAEAADGRHLGQRGDVGRQLRVEPAAGVGAGVDHQVAGEGRCPCCRRSTPSSRRPGS